MSSLCRPEAIRYLTHQIDRLETVDGLVGAAVAVSMHALDDVRPETVVERLDALADRVRRRLVRPDSQALLAHLHAVLFDEEGFTGSIEHYYSPLNSYLPVVLENRSGIPITLCLVYKAVAGRLGIPVDGINAPGHFLVQVHEDSGRTLIDPFDGGRVLARREAVQRIQQALGHVVVHPTHCLEVATHGTWILRMLANLQHIFASSRRDADLAAMIEMRELIEARLA